MSKVSFIGLLMMFLIQCTSTKKVVNYQKELDAHRITYKNGFLTDPRSPLTKDDLANLDFFPPDKSWKLECTCTLAQNAKPFELPTYSGITRTYIVQSDVICKYKNQKISLKLYKNLTQPINPLYKNNLFCPFKDYTNGETTYGGGRYINLYTTDIQDDKIIVDFNKSYNPWCAYSDGYNCPIPPRDNHLELEVVAGEKNYIGEHKKK